jgi:hypothetical protein
MSRKATLVIYEVNERGFETTEIMLAQAKNG